MTTSVNVTSQTSRFDPIEGCFFFFSDSSFWCPPIPVISDSLLPAFFLLEAVACSCTSLTLLEASEKVRRPAATAESPDIDEDHMAASDTSSRSARGERRARSLIPSMRAHTSRVFDLSSSEAFSLSILLTMPSISKASYIGVVANGQKVFLGVHSM